MKKIKVDLSSVIYNIYVGSGITKDLQNLLEINNTMKSIFIITDNRVANLYLENFLANFHGHTINSMVISQGEESKNLETIERIYERMIEVGSDRETIVIGFGGGVVGDIAGYVAATYMRGLNFIQVPTTLLSQVDSSVGGKVAVNFNGIKNLIGAFYQPKAVIIDTEFLKTLDRRDYLSGMGEVFKYGLIKDYNFFRLLEDNFNRLLSQDKDFLAEIIMSSLTIKRDIVEVDEKENNIRKILNFGHTIGHGIEALDGFTRYTHGEAIVLGMMYESLISKKMGLIDEDYYGCIIEVLKKIVTPIRFDDREIDSIMNKIIKDTGLSKEDFLAVL